MGPVPSEISSQVNSGGDVLAYLKAGLDDSEGQHADARHRPGPRPQQHGLASVGGSLLKEALLQGVEGAEVDAHAGDAAQEGLPGLGLERLCYWGTSSRGSGGGGTHRRDSSPQAEEVLRADNVKEDGEHAHLRPPVGGDDKSRVLPWLRW